MDESTGGNDRVWMCFVAGGAEGPELEMRSGWGWGGDGRDGTGWSGGDAVARRGVAWRDARTAFLPLIGEPPGEVI